MSSRPPSAARPLRQRSRRLADGRRRVPVLPRREPPVDLGRGQRDLRVRSDRGLPAVRGVSLRVDAGEVVGIAGVAGNGQQELAEAVAGLRQVEGGAVFLGGADATRLTPRARILRGLRYLPADRHGVATAPNLSVAENLLLKVFRDPAFGSRWWLDRAAVADYARRRMAEFNVVGGA